MDRREFLEKLQRSLANSLSSVQVADNMRYYQEYIDGEIRKGKSEEEVLAMLGEPRLLARSIIEANRQAGNYGGTNQTFDEEMYGNGSYENSSGGARGSSYGDGGNEADKSEVYDEEGKRNVNGRMLRVPGWLVLLIITVVVILIIGVALSMISVFAPVIIPVLVILLLIKVFKGR